MVSYGYLWNGMLQISKSNALKYHLQGIPVYLLYSDNTESAAQSIKNIISHDQKAGLFGIEKCMNI